MLRQAARFADRVATEAGTEPAAQIAHAYELALGRRATAEEQQVGLAFLRGGRTLGDFAHVLLNLNEFIYLR